MAPGGGKTTENCVHTVECWAKKGEDFTYILKYANVFSEYLNFLFTARPGSSSQQRCSLCWNIKLNIARCRDISSQFETQKKATQKWDRVFHRWLRDDAALITAFEFSWPEKPHWALNDVVSLAVEIEGSKLNLERERRGMKSLSYSILCNVTGKRANEKEQNLIKETTTAHKP